MKIQQRKHKNSPGKSVWNGKEQQRVTNPWTIPAFKNNNNKNKNFLQIREKRIYWKCLSPTMWPTALAGVHLAPPALPCGTYWDWWKNETLASPYIYISGGSHEKETCMRYKKLELSNMLFPPYHSYLL